MKGMGNLGNLNKLMKQAQAMQDQMARVQEELESRKVEATSGGGAVKVVMTGKMDVAELKIDPGAVDPQEVDMLEDLILAALREAKSKAEAMAAEEMGKVTGGMGLPGMF